jgi:uncharacterized RDD family membrane protein YckC
MNIRPKRFVALAIDLNIAAFIALALSVLGAFFSVGNISYSSNRFELGRLTLTPLVLPYWSAAVFMLLKDLLFHNRGVGKWVMGLQVRDGQSHAAAGPWQKILRNMLLLLLFPLELFLGLQRKSGRRIGDLIAGTTVSDTHPLLPEATLTRKQVLLLLSGFLAASILLLLPFGAFDHRNSSAFVSNTAQLNPVLSEKINTVCRETFEPDIEFFNTEVYEPRSGATRRKVQIVWKTTNTVLFQQKRLLQVQMRVICDSILQDTNYLGEVQLKMDKPGIKQVSGFMIRD